MDDFEYFRFKVKHFKLNISLFRSKDEVDDALNCLIHIYAGLNCEQPEYLAATEAYGAAMETYNETIKRLG